MDAELKTLEEKIVQTVQLCQRLRAENIHLRQELATVRDENKRMHDKIDGAASRLETLLQHIPEVAEE
jgi:cell division protein ZapB